jgi:Flp pilus assembly protein protease CpaA
MELIDIFGYCSMIVTLVSMMMKDMKKLRIINSISCAMFIIYGIYLSAFPIIILNSLVIFINVYRLLFGE